MQIYEELKSKVLSINNDKKFRSVALELYELHKQHNPIYRQFVETLPSSFQTPTKIEEIPFLPIGFFKSHTVQLEGLKAEEVFTSSGTTGTIPSRNLVPDLAWYLKVSLNNFEFFYGDIEQYCILALLPSYLEREGSSLVVMADELIKKSKNSESGFYLNDFESLFKKLQKAKKQGVKTILLGVSFALLDFIEKHELHFPELIIMETGGMKGRRKELIREELHEQLMKGFGTETIHSEYGMTELFSQAYSKGNGKFQLVPWMRVFIRDTNDPFTIVNGNETGGINIIDLANIYSCPFIATQDLGKVSDGNIEILGRFDNSDIRGCNLMAL